MSSADLLYFLASTFTEPIRDPLWGNVFLSPALERLASSVPFAKLGRIKQLGPAYLVYPGATHTRRAHSIGVFHMARRIAWALAAKGQLDFCSREGLQSFLVAALCHDLGHFPFAHSLKELPLEDHEALTGRELRTEPLRSLAREAGADPEAAAAIVDKGNDDRGDREIRFFRGLLSGVLDPDKLDYLNRDAFFCGVPYGLQDSDFILQRLAVGPGDTLAIEERGLMSVECLLFSKYLMYRSVYWHRGVRSATAMIKKAVLMALNEGKLSPKDLYGLDDDGFYSMLRGIRYGPFALAAAVFEGRIYGTVLDLPFSEFDERHRGLLDLGSRLKVEAALAAEAGGGFSSLDLVIDVPEAISFETDLPVLLDPPDRRGDERPVLPFPRSSTVFTPPVIAGFARSLRRVRVFARESSERLEAAARAMFG
ncbi:MAG: HD domain-containing protein [Rectinemataceae bacterium]|jgi:HD superfamily phosphohydrolase